MSAETIVRLKIQSSDYDPQQITSMLAQSPDKSWVKGERRVNTIITESMNGWLLNSGVSSNTSINQQARALFLRLGGVGFSALANAKGCFEVELSCVIYDSTMPALYIEPDVVMMAASIGAAIDFDVYVTE